MAVTIKDVSKDASVSIKTVSRVINNEANVAEATKNKVLASVKKLGFKPNKSAQSLRSISQKRVIKPTRMTKCKKFLTNMVQPVKLIKMNKF